MPRATGLKPIDVSHAAHAAVKRIAKHQGRKLHAVASDAILKEREAVFGKKKAIQNHKSK